MSLRKYQPPSEPPVSRLKIGSAFASHAGNVRECNEDFCAAEDAGGLFVLSDGMGGGPDGRLASELVCSVMLAHRAKDHSWSDAVKIAHLELRFESRKRNGTCEAGATVAALAIERERYDLAWVGDSRIYRWNGGLTLLTQDHSIVQGLMASDVIQPDDIESHPCRHLLTQALGKTHTDKLRPESMSGRVYPGDRFVRCSDGLYDAVPDTRLSALLGRYLETDQAVRALLDVALELRAEDNVSVLIVDVR